MKDVVIRVDVVITKQDFEIKKVHIEGTGFDKHIVNSLGSKTEDIVEILSIV